ncbi:MAG: hypothetical protein HRT45_19390, partial [Bdellovibrionales bacterium]|nr:hypothetical protein [Bdellovibrionales bacterium]
FATVSMVGLSEVVESNLVTMSGMNQYQRVYAGNGAEVSVSGGAGWQAGWGAASVTGGDTLQLRMTSASGLGEEKTTTIRLAHKRLEWTTQTTTDVDLFIADAATVMEGETLQFVVTISEPTGLDLAFDWQANDDTAESDYNHYVGMTIAERVTILSGDTGVTLQVVSNDVNYVTGDLSLEVTITNPGLGVNVVDGFATGAIGNNDTVPADIVFYGYEGFYHVVSSNLRDFYMIPRQTGVNSSAYCHGKWYLLGNSSNSQTTTDFVTFQSLTITPATGTNAAICYENRLFVVDNRDSITFTDDGETWVASVNSSLNTQSAMDPMAFHKDKIYIGGDNYVIKVSDDFGATFTDAITISGGVDDGEFLSGIVAANDTLLAIDGAGSPDSFLTTDEFASTTVITFSGMGTSNFRRHTFRGDRYTWLRTGNGRNTAYTDDFANFEITDGSTGSNDGVMTDLGYVASVHKSPVILISEDLSETVAVTITTDLAVGRDIQRTSYGGEVIDPGLLAFNNLTEQATSTLVESSVITLASTMTRYQRVYAGNGAEVRIDGDSWQTGDGVASITGGQSLQIRATTASTLNTDTNVTVWVGPQSTDWTLRTLENQIFISDAAAPVNEGGNLQFVVSLAVPASGNVSFNYTTVDGLAEESILGFPSESDYVAQSAVPALILDGTSSVTLSVATLTDIFDEEDEDLGVTLSGLSSAVEVIDGFGVGTIQDVNPSVSGTVRRVAVDANTGTLLVTTDDTNFFYLNLKRYLNVYGEVAYCDGRWVFNGSGDSKILTTTDLANFTEIDLSVQYGSSTATTRHVACFGGDWVAGSDNNVLLHSSDGVNWLVSSNPGTFIFQDGFDEYRGKIWAGGQNGELAFSNDRGASFVTSDVLTTSTDYRSVIGVNDRLLAFGPASSSNHLYSEDEFISYSTFNIAGADMSRSAFDVVHLDDRVISYFDGSEEDFYSDDQGDNWTVISTLTADDSQRGEFADGEVWIGLSGGRIGKTATGLVPYTILGDYSQSGGSGPSVYDIQYGSPDLEPDNFGFAAISLAALSTNVESEVITLSGFTVPQGVYAGNSAEARVNGGTYEDGWGGVTVGPGDTLQLRMLSSASLDTLKTSTIKIANREIDWSVRTTATSLTGAITLTSAGNVETITVAAGVTSYEIELWGAAGGGGPLGSTATG